MDSTRHSNWDLSFLPYYTLIEYKKKNSRNHSQPQKHVSPSNSNYRQGNFIWELSAVLIHFVLQGHGVGRQCSVGQVFLGIPSWGCFVLERLPHVWRREPERAHILILCSSTPLQVTCLLRSLHFPNNPPLWPSSIFYFKPFTFAIGAQLSPWPHLLRLRGFACVSIDSWKSFFWVPASHILTMDREEEGISYVTF